MGCKFYRGSDKTKKIRKRFTQTRSWFRQFKWLACKYNCAIGSACQRNGSCIQIQ